MLSPGRRSSACREQRRSPVPSPSPIPQPKSQREPVPARELACTAQTPNAVLLWIHPSGRGSNSLPVPQGPSGGRSGKEKRAELAPPDPMHLANPPQLIRQIPPPQAWQCTSSPGGPRHPTVNPTPRRGEEKAHTSLTVAPAVGWGQTSGLTAALPTNASYSRQHRGRALQFHATPGTIRMTKWKNSPQKKLQEVATANELIKNNLSDVTEN